MRNSSACRSSPRICSDLCSDFREAQAGRDLDLWQTYEAENPSAFTGMYQFWIRKKSRG